MTGNPETTEICRNSQKSTQSLWRQKNFLSLMLGSGLSVLGDGAYFIVLGWFVLNLTGSEFALGTTLTVASIPRIVFMLLGGAVADRVDKKRILVASLLLRFTILLVFVGMLLGDGNHVGLWDIDLMALLFGTIDAFFYPASNSVIPSAVPDLLLAQANSFIQTVQQVSTVLGPLLAAGLLWMGGYPVMFVTIGILFALSSIALSMLRIGRQPAPMRGSGMEKTGKDVADKDSEEETTTVVPPKSSMFRDILEGVQYVRSVKILVLIMVVSLGINLLLMGPINIGVPTFVKSMGWSGDVYGTYESGFGIGTVVGGLIVILLKGMRGRFLWIGAFGALMGVAYGGIGFVHVAWGGIALMGLMGLAISVINIPILTYIQAIVPSDKLGRTMSLLTLMSVGLVPVSYTASSFILQQPSVHVSELMGFCGSLIILLFLSLYLFRAFREVESDPRWQAKVQQRGVPEAVETGQ